MSLHKGYLAHLKGLDLLRFLLSFSIIVYHYRYFYLNGSGTLSFDEFPFYRFIWPVYQYGHYAVEIFWMISGFIFYTIYHDNIANKGISIRNFILLRLTRLYPLHFLTLILCLVFQQLYYSQAGTFYTNSANDAKHFFLQLLFISNWDERWGPSYNRPIWSVSIEILVYILFFVLASSKFLTKTRDIILTILFFLFCMSLSLGLVIFNECIVLFLFGCLLCKIIDRKALLASIVIFTLLYLTLLDPVLHTIIPGKADLVLTILNINLKIYRVLFSLSITLVFIKAFSYSFNANKGYNYFTMLGNLTYAMYLIHFPTQVLMMLIMKPAGYQAFNNEWVFIIYLLSVVVISIMAYYLFEKKVQKLMRRLLIKEKISG